MKNFISLIFISLFLFAGCEEKLATLEAKNKLITGPSFDLALTTMPASFDDDATPDFIFAATNNIPNVDHYECSLNSAAFSLCTSPITLPTLAEGSHTFSVKAFDSAGKFEQVDHSWVVSLMDLTDLSYFSQEVSVLFSHDFNPTGGSGNYSFSLPTNPNGASINAAGIFSVTEATFGLYSYVVRVTDTTTSLYFDYNFNLEITQSPICVWTGAVDTDWANAGNWRTCSGAAPIATSKVIVGPAANQPILSVDATIDSFGEGSGGGTVTINSGVELLLMNATQSVQSNVSFKGQTSTCNNCDVVSNTHFYIVNNATVGLDQGAGLRPGVGRHQYLYIGDGVSAGHLKTISTSVDPTEWPIIGGHSNARDIRSIVLNGAVNNHSSIELDGIRFQHKSQHTTQPVLRLTDYYDILKFDNIEFAPGAPAAGTVSFNTSMFEIDSCANSNITDLDWSNINFLNPFSPSGKNIVVTNADCAAHAAITVSGTGNMYGHTLETDPNSIINWSNSLTMNCVWSGSVDTDWRNPGNWNSCANGRENFPDHIDNILIPITANQPVITQDESVLGITAGAGGGTITINSGQSLTLNSTTNAIRSDIIFKGQTSTCSNCNVISLSDLYVTDNATVSLDQGASIRVGKGRHLYMYLGNGASAGHLRTVNTSANSNEWPIIGGTNGTNDIRSIVLNGTVSDHSSINVDGIRFQNKSVHTTEPIIRFVNFYDIDKFDNVELTAHNSSAPPFNTHMIEIQSCANASITDLNWDNITFTNSASYSGINVSAVNANCSGQSPITISGTGALYGELLDNDTNNILNWANSLTQNCIWTGTIDSDWRNPGNWNSCTNARNNYPDHIDTVVIPVTGNQPVISQNETISGFGVGAGGGTITVNANIDLLLYSKEDTIQSDIAFKGQTSTCTNCDVISRGELYVVNDATIGLDQGIAIRVGLGRHIYMYLGDGASAGHLETVSTSADPNEWPIIGGTNGTNDIRSILFNGAAGQYSSINIDGLHFQNKSVHTAEPIIRYVDYFNIINFDNARLIAHNNSAPTFSRTMIDIESCLNATFTDTSWDSIEFVNTLGAGGYNISVTDASCAGIGVISLPSASGAASGAGFEEDPGNVINWP